MDISPGSYRILLIVRKILLSKKVLGRGTDREVALKLLKTRLTRFSLATILCLLVAAPASAGTIYDNGPINGTIDAWTINFGFQVADSFTVSSASNLTGAQVGLWLFSGDNPTSLDWMIGTAPGLGDISSGTGAALSNTFLPGTNPYNYLLAESNFTLTGAVAPSTTYWLTIQNASTPSGDPIYWDQNNGPSQGWENTLGYGMGGCSGTNASCSESFQIYGNSGTATPEPASWVLLGSGMLIFAGFMRKFAS
jgi:hypothetical protein